MSFSQACLTGNVHSHTNSTNGRKRYKQWSEEEELKLMEMINKKEKNVKELTDTDWSEIAQKFNLVPQQVFWKAKRL
jgi:uncharacterized FlgJ-related protein